MYLIVSLLGEHLPDWGWDHVQIPIFSYLFYWFDDFGVSVSISFLLTRARPSGGDTRSARGALNVPFAPTRRVPNY
eukprot:4409105-Amphidinium_carterae.1